MRTCRARVGIIAGAVALLLASQAQAADLNTLLRRSVTAERRVTYQGRKVLNRYYPGGRVSSSTYKAYHLAPDRSLMVGVDGEQEGTRLVVIGPKNYVRQAYTRSYVEPPIPPPSGDNALLLKNYRVQPMRVEMIARRRCQMVALWPKHRGNPSKLVWIDLETALPLKTQIRDADGSLTDESYFLFIDYHPKFSRRIFATDGPIIREWPEVEPDFDPVGVRSEFLPKGYRWVRTLNRRTPQGHIVSFQRFSNGLNTITLVESLTHPNPGAVAGSCVVEGRVGRLRFAICGEHGQEALRKMAKGLKGKPVTFGRKN